MTFTALDRYREPLSGVTPGATVLYPAYQTQSDLLAPLRAAAGLAVRASQPWRTDFARNAMLMNLGATYEIIARMGFSHARPPFGIDHVVVDDREVPVEEKAVDATPFGTLLRFAKDTDVAAILKEGWQQSAWDQFQEKFPKAPLLFYINHLGWEVANAKEVFAPAA